MTKLWTCPRCKEAFPYDQPTILQGCVGYQTPVHGCGDGFVAVRLRPSSAKAKAFWAKVKSWTRGEG